MSESPKETRIKRLRLRSWRRGTREMDLILGPFADAHLGAMAGPEIDAFETLLEENDQDLYGWISGQATPPPRLEPQIRRIGDFVRQCHGKRANPA